MAVQTGAVAGPMDEVLAVAATIDHTARRRVDGLACDPRSGVLTARGLRLLEGVEQAAVLLVRTGAGRRRR